MDNLEQPANVGSTNYGKFKDAESLLKAYTNLESEFTKKSQKLAQLESESEKAGEELLRQEKIEKDVEDFVTKFEVARPFKSAIKESVQKGESAESAAFGLLANNYKTAEQYIGDQEFLNNYVFNNTEIKDKIIKEYLNKLTSNSPVKIDFKAGNIPLTPPFTPTSIKEAGVVARTIIKQK